MSKIKAWYKGQELISEVEVLIVGGTTVGVALALELENHGISVFLAASRPYLGEDVYGDLKLWPEKGLVPQSDLAKAIFADEVTPVTPMHAKLTLEQALVEKDIPFLLNTYSAGILKSGGGTIGGVVFSTRSGFKTVRSQVVIDATTEGVLATLTGEPSETLFKGKRTIIHRTLCHGDGTDAKGVHLLERLPGYEGKIGEKSFRLSARTYKFEVDFGEGSLREIAQAEVEIGKRCWVPGEYCRQERICLADEETAKNQLLDFDAMEIRNGLLNLSSYYLCSEKGATPSSHPITGMDAAESIGKTIRRFLENSNETKSELSVFPSELKTMDACDVLVLGGGTGGASAGIASAREGADTIIVEMMDQLGGVGTVGQISRYWFGNRVGFTSEIDQGVADLETDEKLKKNIGQWTLSAKAHWLEDQADKAGAIILYRSMCGGVEVEDNRVTGLYVATPNGFGLIKVKSVVDASGCADVAAAAGAPTVKIGSEHVAVQGTGLAGLEPGRDYHNSDHNFCDDTNVFDTTSFLVSSKLKFKDHFDGGQLVDSRERRQIIGDVVLQPSDFLSEKRYYDTICLASSNFDSHGFTIHPLFMCKAPDKKRLWADVPFRTFLPLGLERVIVTGLGISAHRDALPVIRMQADVQNHGYAAGHAAALSAKTGLDFRKLSIKKIQKHLVEIGNLPERVLTDTDRGDLSKDEITQAVVENWDELSGLAIIFANTGQSLPILRSAIKETDCKEKALRYALILALCGDCSGKAELIDYVKNNPWDQGWNYRGMGQFGFSLSPMDVHIIALGRIGDQSVWPILFDKIESLPSDPAFSHCRAVAEACELLYHKDPIDSVAGKLYEILKSPNMSEHALVTIKSVQSKISSDPNETHLRNLALREIHLLRALHRCGDFHGKAQAGLKYYARDLRGAFSDHAKAVLTEVKIPCEDC